MPSHGQDNQPYGHTAAIDWLGELVDSLARAYPRPKPKPAPAPKPDKSDKK